MPCLWEDTMSRKPTKPPPYKIPTDDGDHISVRVHSGPRDDGRWRWRAEHREENGTRKTIWTGWGTKDEATKEVRRVLDGQGASEIKTVDQLLLAWSAAREERADLRPRTIDAHLGSIGRLLE